MQKHAKEESQQEIQLSHKTYLCMQKVIKTLQQKLPLHANTEIKLLYQKIPLHATKDYIKLLYQRLLFAFQNRSKDP